MAVRMMPRCERSATMGRMPALTLRIWATGAAALLNVLALAGWTGTTYAAAVLVYYALGRVDHPPVLPFVAGCAVLMGALGGFWRARDIISSETTYRAERAALRS